MKSQYVLFVIGGLLGALAAYLLVSSFDSPGGPTDDSRSGLPSVTLPTAVGLSRQSGSSIQSASSLVRREITEAESRIEDDPIGALRDAAALPEPADRRRAVMSIGTEWAGIDPAVALQSATMLPVELQADFLASVSSTWANLDADSFFSYARGADDLETLTEGLNLLIASDPAQVYEIAGRLPVDTGSAAQGGLNELQRAALTALADREPDLAMSYVEPMLPQLGVNVFAQGIVTRFARSDPDAALAWLDSLAMTSSSHRRVVLGGIAGADFDRALHLAEEGSTTISFLDSAIARGALSDPERAAEVATDLLNRDSAFADQVLKQLTASWVRRDPDRFFDWFQGHSGSLDQPLVASIASAYAVSDIQFSMAMVDRLPQGMKSTWIEQLAGPYAARNPRAALTWVQQYQGQPFYEAAYSQVIVQLANADPDLAAMMLDDLSPALRSAAAPRIAQTLSARDPETAADWAYSLTEPAVAAAAVSNVVTGWIRRDLQAASSWVLDLERGEVRDEGLMALISGSYGTNLDPRPILDEIDSERTRRQATRLAIFRSGPDRLDIARQLLENMLDDPEYGDWARETLEGL